MKWRVDFSAEALKFLARNRIGENVIFEKISIALKKINGERVNVDIKKLGGKWEGFYRIRVGKLRIIIEFHFQEFVAYIEVIDWRGKVYK